MHKISRGLSVKKSPLAKRTKTGNAALLFCVKLSKHSFFDRMKEIMSDSKTKTYFIVISAKNLIYDYLVVIVVPYKGG